MPKMLLDFWKNGSDDPFDVFFEHAPIMMHSINADGYLVNVSNFLAEALGYTQTEMIGRKSLDFLTQASQDLAINTVLPAFFKTGRISEQHYDLVRKDGSILPVNLSAVAQYFPDGTFHRSLAILADYSDAIKNEGILEAALEAIPEGFVIYDENDRLIRCNDAYRAIYSKSAPVIREGTSFEAILRFGLEHGQYPEAGTTVESHSKWLEKRLKAHSQPKEKVLQQFKKDGWLSIHEIRTSTGHTVGIRHDVSELKKAQTEAERFGRILDHSTQGIFVFDATTLKLEIVNSTAQKNLQYSMSELREMTLEDICVVSEGTLSLSERIKQLIDEKITYLKYTSAHQRKDGTIYPCSVRLELDCTNGESTVIALCEDVSEREALQLEITERNMQLAQKNEELIEVAAEAERANRAKSTFLANMSHEIRTPLNGVLGMTNALSQSDLSPAQTNMTEVILSSGHQLLTLLNDILDLSKIESGDISLDTETTDASAILSEVAALFDVSAEEKGLSIAVQVSSSSRKKILANASRIRQVVINLVSNAIKFTESGTVTLSAALEENASNRAKLMLTIADTGKGVPDHMKNVIFGRFEQGNHTVENAIGGTGLGLSIARMICELHGGTLTVEDAPTGGARFIATFDVELQNTNTRQEPIKADPIMRLKALSRPLRILVAEDNDMNRRVLAALLQSAPAVATSYAHNGWEGLEKMKTEEFDAALVDIRMPVMNGLEMISIHRDNERLANIPTMPFVACSANTMTDQVAHYKEQGFGKCISKPLDHEKLADCFEWIIAELDRQDSTQNAQISNIGGR